MSGNLCVAVGEIVGPSFCVDILDRGVALRLRNVRETGDGRKRSATTLNRIKVHAGWIGQFVRLVGSGLENGKFGR